jgi:hypothetical protein
MRNATRMRVLCSRDASNGVMPIPEVYSNVMARERAKPLPTSSILSTTTYLYAKSRDSLLQDVKLLLGFKWAELLTFLLSPLFPASQCQHRQQLLQRIDAKRLLTSWHHGNAHLSLVSFFDFVRPNVTVLSLFVAFVNITKHNASGAWQPTRLRAHPLRRKYFNVWMS